LLGWFAWLSYTALTKSHEPIVPPVQAAAAQVAVRATVEIDEKGAPSMQATVVEWLRGPQAASEKILVVNLSTAHGFTGKGDYLLLLAQEFPGVYHVLGARGTFGTESDPPTIYPWGPGVVAQEQRLFQAKE
jgi:hypothetical protein